MAQSHTIPEMIDPALHLQGGGDYHDMIYFPVKINAMISMFLSGFATAIIVSISLIFKLYKRPLARMVLVINMAHVLFYFSKISVLLFPPRSELHCRILSIIVVFGIESAVFWGALFAHLFYVIIKSQSMDEVPLMMKYYVLVAVILPFVSGILSSFTKFLIYSESLETCVHRVYADHFDLSYDLHVLIPVWLACILSTVWYKKAISKISDLQWNSDRNELYVLLIYPGVLMFCWGLHLVLQTIIQMGTSPSQTLIDISISLVNLQGFFDALVYGRSVKEALKDRARSHYGRKISQEEEIVEVKSNREMSAGSYSYLMGEEINKS